MFLAKYQDLNATINPDICTFLSRMKLRCAVCDVQKQRGKAEVCT